MVTQNFKAQVTVFLSLIMVILLGFIGSMIEVTKIHNIKANARMYNEGAIQSVFAEYHSKLQKKYGIFTLDATYEGNSFHSDNVLERLSFFGGNGDCAEITELQLLSDYNGAAFLDQVIYYMKDTTVSGFFDNLLGNEGSWEEVTSEDIEENLSFLGELQENITTNLESQEDTEEQAENPLNIFSGLDMNGMLNLVLSKEDEVSKSSVTLELMPSKRVLQKGIGVGLQNTSSSTIQKAYLVEYIMKKFTSALKDKEIEESLEELEETKELKYQIEYILSEKSSDKENLKAVVHKLILMRAPINYAVLYQDVAKKAEVYTLATTLAALVGAVGTEEIIAQALMLSWSYGESIVDVKSLLAGKKLKVVKETKDWQLDLGSMLNLGQENLVEGMGDDEGMGYEDYLRILLYLKNIEELPMLTLDMVENYMQNAENQKWYKVDSCINRIKVIVDLEIGDEYSYEFPVFNGYK